MREIVLYIPNGARNRDVLTGAAEALVRSLKVVCSRVDSERILESTLRLTTMSVTLVVAPGNLENLAAAIKRIHDSREPNRPTARFVILDAKNFPPGKRPLHTRIFALDRSEDAKAAVALALDAASVEQEDLIKNQVSRI